MIQAILFVCAVAVHPHACNIETAISTSQGPKVANEMMCGKSSQVAMASQEWKAPRYPEEYLKVSCVKVDDRV